MRLRTICCLLLITLSQGLPKSNFFSMYNGRNHPELNWQVLETEHIRIIFHQGLKDEAREAAKIAETSYGPITQNLKHEPPGKIPIYISDQDDITNGFAVANRFIAIWVNVNDYIGWTTGPDKWLRMVIAHEMVHYVHFSAINTWLGLPGMAFNGTPGWFIEGLAQYESETWNVHRGDLLLRTAVIEDEMNYHAGKWITNGRLMYAAGNSMVRYLADTYGDSALVSILHDRKKVLGVPFYSFGSSFSKAVDKKSFENFYREWRRHVNIYYNTYYGQKEDINDFAGSFNLPVQYINGLQFSPDEQWVAITGIIDLDEPLSKLCLIKNDSTRAMKILVQSGVDAHFSFAPDGSRIAYSRVRRGPHGSLQQDIFVTDLNGKSRRITTDTGACQPDWSPDGQWIACIIEQDGAANLFRVRPDGSDLTAITCFTGDIQMGTPRWSPDGRSIVVAISGENGHRDLALIDAESGAMQLLTNDAGDDRAPVWSPAGDTIVFSGYRGGVPDVYQLPVSSPDSIRQVTDTASGLYPMDWQADSLICLLYDSRRKTTAVKLAANRTPELSNLNINEKYTSWQTHQPPNGIPPLVISGPEVQTVKTYKYNSLKNIQHYLTVPVPCKIEDSWGLLFMTAWTEPLNKHVFTGFGFADAQQPKDSRYVLAYINNSFYPTISTTIYRMPSTGQIIDDKLLIEETRGGFVDVSFPLNFGDNLYSNHRLSVYGDWQTNDPLNEEDFENPTIPIEKKSVGELGLTYAWKSIRPNDNNFIHPKQGMGLRLHAAFADAKWNSDLTYKRALADGFANITIPFIGDVLYLRARAEAADGRLRSQNFIGFDKYDQPDFGMGLKFSERERLRGIKEYMFGDRLWMATAEYRIDFIENLGWQAAGIQLQRVTLAGFSDIGSTWYAGQNNWQNARIHKTYGVEFKNEVNFGGFIFAHEFGWAWKWNSDSDPEQYYRIRAVMPF